MVEREDIPGGRNGQLVRDGFTFDTGPTVLTMRDLVADALRAVDADLDELLPMRRLDPAYRAQFADGVHDPGALRPRGDAERDRRHLRLGRRGRLRRLRRLAAASCTWSRCRTSSTATSTRRSTCCRRPDVAAQAGPARRLRPARQRHPATVPRRPAAPAVQLPGHVRRSGPRRGPGHLRGDHLHGQHRGRLVPRRAACTRCRSRWPRPRRRRAPSSATAPRCRRCSGARTPAGVAGVRLDSGEQLAADAVVCTLDLPTAYEKLLPDLSPPRALRRPRYSPSAVVWHVGVRGLPDPEVSHHNIHFGQEWGGAFDDLLKRGTLMARPVAAGHHPLAGRSRRWPRKAARRCSSSSRCPTSPTGRSTGCASAVRCGSDCSASSPPRATRPTSSPRSWSPRSTGRRRAWRPGPRSRWRTPSPRPGPFRPANVERRVPGLVFAGSGTVPGSGCRWCSSPGSWRPIASTSTWGAGPRAGRSHAGRSGGSLDECDPGRPTRASCGPVTGECGRLTRQFGTTYFWGAALLPRASAQARLRRVRPLPAGRRHRRSACRPRGASEQTFVPGTGWGGARSATHPPAVGVGPVGDDSEVARRLRTSRTGSGPPWSTASATTRCWPRWPPPLAPATSTRSASTGSSGRWRWT